jgi:hypothetical protein
VSAVYLHNEAVVERKPAHEWCVYLRVGLLFLRFIHSERQTRLFVGHLSAEGAGHRQEALQRHDDRGSSPAPYASHWTGCGLGFGRVLCATDEVSVTEDRRALSSFRLYRGPSIFFIVYSTADRVSFDEVVSFWLWVVARTLSYLPNVALIGIHSDRSRQVSKADGAKLAKQCGIPFFEVDSRTGKPDDMEKAVASAVRIGRKWRLFFYGQSEEQWPAPFRVNHRMHEYYPTREDFVIWERSREMSRPLPLPHELDKARLSISGALPPSPTDSGFSGESSVFDSMPSSPSSTFSKDSGFSEGSFWDKQSVIPSAASVKSKALCIIM